MKSKVQLYLKKKKEDEAKELHRGSGAASQYQLDIQALTNQLTEVRKKAHEQEELHSRDLKAMTTQLQTVRGGILLK